MKVNIKIALLAFLFGPIIDANAAGLVPFPDSYDCKPGTKTLVPDRPTARTQSISTNLCYATTAEYVMVKQMCLDKKLTCKNITSDNRISLFDLIRYGKSVKNAEERANAKTYTNISVKDLGGSFEIIENKLSSNSRVVKESCAPYDAFVSKGKSPKEQQKMDEEIWTRLEKAYNDYKNCGEKCASYLVHTTANELNENYDNKVTDVEVLAAFGSATYEEFLGKVLVPEECTKIKNQLLFAPQQAQLRGWPLATDKRSFKEVFDKLALVTDKGKPVGLQGICLDDVVSTPCKRPHAAPVTGTCEMCSEGGKGSDCKPAIKIENSYGETWQKENHDGWIEAETAIERTPYKQKNKMILYWIEDLTK